MVRCNSLLHRLLSRPDDVHCLIEGKCEKCFDQENLISLLLRAMVGILAIFIALAAFFHLFRRVK